MPNNIAHHIPTVAAVQQQQRSPMMGNGIMPNAAAVQGLNSIHFKILKKIFTKKLTKLARIVEILDNPWKMFQKSLKMIY